MFDPAPHIDWLLSEGRLRDLQGLIDGLGVRLRACGIPLMRVRLGMRTTHPLITALSVFWEADRKAIEQFTTPHGLETRSTYIGSPMETIAQTRAPFRRRLAKGLTDQDHTSLHELKQRGATDYYGLPLTFAFGSSGLVIFVADGPAGFADSHIDAFDRLATALAPVIEAHSNHQLATAIAESYLGTRTGRRVLAGQITRGDIETIEAAILFSDIRGWTALNATRSAQEALDIANRYFEIISDAVDAHDGEILKFMGDGCLALFPSDGTDPGRSRSCAQAVSAAQAAQDLAVKAALSVPFGIGIHFGEVLYGNVGAHTRIDFTVLGQAVNIAARVEACCGRLAELVLLSDTVADMVGISMEHVATEQLKGLENPMQLYAPR